MKVANKKEAYKRNHWCLLDTSFILSAIRNKIDFLDEIKNLGLTPIVPKQVLVELEGISKSKSEAELALKIINKVKKIDLKTKNTDAGIIKYAKNNKIIIATLDKEIKNKTKNQKLIIRGKNKIEIS
jgi:rRNA-processing protein FCF1